MRGPGKLAQTRAYVWQVTLGPKPLRFPSRVVTRLAAA